MEPMCSSSKYHHGLSTILDDSSSTTSKSSGGHSGKCRRCGEPESLPSKPLLHCPSCHKKRWHPHCHQPPVDARNVPKDWKCKACLNAASRPLVAKAPAKVPSAAPPSPTSTKMSARLCKEPGCDKPIFQTLSQLCQTHKIEQQYRMAAAMKQAGTPIASPGSTINKRGLYPFKLDGDLKQKQSLKRKRAAAKRNVSDNALPVLDGVTMGTHLQKPLQSGPRSPASNTLSANLTMQRTPERRRRQSNLLAGIGSDQTPINDIFNSSLGSASIAESLISPDILTVERNYSIPYSARRTPQSTREHISPEYSPPPPADVTPGEVNYLWAQPNHDDSPGSQINQELRAILSRPQVSQDMSQDLGGQKSPVITGFNFEREDGDVVPAKQDEKMPDFLSTGAVKEILGNAVASDKVQISPSPALSLLSSFTSSIEDMDFEEDTISNAVEEMCLEERREQKAATFDSSELDSFLTKQAELQSDEQATSQELAKTQIWGHIDPRVAWPKEMSEEELAEKRGEIDARGGKKANYGKLLTAQVRKERKEKGWNVHQNSEAVPDHIMAETARHMEELFGVKIDDTLVPGVRDGQLVMMEKPVDDTGKRKRKAALKYYPVF